MIHLLTLDGGLDPDASRTPADVWDLAFSPDGREAGKRQFRPHAQDLGCRRPGRLIRTAGEHGQAIGRGFDMRRQRRADRHRRGRRQASCCGGRTATRCARSTPGSFVDALAFSADGQWLVTAARREPRHPRDRQGSDRDGTHSAGRIQDARLWRVADGAMIAALDRQPGRRCRRRVQRRRAMARHGK